MSGTCGMQVQVPAELILFLFYFIIIYVLPHVCVPLFSRSEEPLIDVRYFIYIYRVTFIQTNIILRGLTLKGFCDESIYSIFSCDLNIIAVA